MEIEKWGFVSKVGQFFWIKGFFSLPYTELSSNLKIGDLQREERG